MIRSSRLSVLFLAPLAVACGGVTDGTADPGAVGETASAATAAALPVVAPRFVTPPPIRGYDEAPRTPASDDPAIWVHPQNRGASR